MKFTQDQLDKVISSRLEAERRKIRKETARRRKTTCRNN
jgi:hypothetical protein